ncbi:DUF433 domain-containing protein [Ancylobacter sp. G4_0304]|uniref:DUF433 domain-containing protein n=1 Tax=Ancylobacter sp. G4_0304 TaxID=3114289 RepID=UPI0039C6C482
MHGKGPGTPSDSVLDIGNVIAAFSEEQVERMTGLSKARLRYWARTDFFKPSFVEDDLRRPYSRFYSFKDMVALKTLEVLRVRNDVPLQHLRKVAAKLHHLKNDLWTNTTLFVLNKEVCFVNPETRQPEAAVSGQYVLETIPLKEIIEDTKTSIVAFSQRRKGSEGQVDRARSIARNAWVISGTRIPVSAIRRLYEDGFSTAQIIEEYPDLTPEDVVAALRHSGVSAA